MNKRGGFFYVFFLIILLGALVFSAYYLYIYWPREPVDLQIVPDNYLQNKTLIENNLPSKQFYHKMRYSDRVITYSIADSCTSDRASAMKGAFANLEARTVLKFGQINSNDAMIKVLCSDVAPEAGQENYFVAGEGGPSRVLNSTLYSVILEGKISLFREDKCDGSKVATHELLHALGFDHNNNLASILYPTLKCDQEIDTEIIDSINRLYRHESLPDLVFYLATATKSGRYLNFNVEVLNQGLSVSGPTKVSVYADNEFADNFDIGAVSIGSRKILTVENLKLPGDTNKIVFVVDEENTAPELFENNNQIILRLVEQE